MKHSLLPCLLLFVLLMPLFLFPSFAPAEAASPKVYILADGSVQGTSSIQRNGDVYTLVGDVVGPLYVQKDNVVIDGAGYTVTGANGRGIVLSQRHGVTVKDTRVTLDGGHIIDVSDAADCALIGNTLVGTPGPISGPIAIHFLHSQRITVKDNTITNFFEALSLGASSGHTITGNTITDGVLGISIENTTGCVLRNNNLRNCGFSVSTFRGSELDNDLDTSNTVNGKPIYYWVNVKDQAVPSDAAYIALVKCANITVSGVNPQGICIVSTSDSAISNVNLGKVTMNQRGDGINLLDSSSISIIDSVVHDKGIGIKIENSSNTLVSGNNISNQITKGIDLVNAADTVISGNTFTNNNLGIGCTPYSLSSGAVVGTTVAYNNFTGNDNAVRVCGDMKINNNVFNHNEVGIIFSDYSGNTVTENIFSNNKNALYFSASSGNSIYLNNFLENEHQVTDAGAGNSQTQPTKASSNSIGSVQLVAAHVDGVNFLPPPPPSHNQYDDGAKGNYWIDYTGSDGNRDGIGDTAYYLYEGNQDNHPLMNPVTISTAVMTPTQIPQPTPTSSTNLPQGSTEPTDTGISQGIGILQLPIEYVVLAIAALIAAVGLLVYFKKNQTKKKASL